MDKIKKVSFFESCNEKSNREFREYEIKSMGGIKTTAVYEAYWRFAVERQNIFFKRFSGEKAPWTNDEIIQKYKFTNAYRASDRVSQYLLKNVIYNGNMYNPEDVFFRIMLFKFFNKIDTWEYLENVIGDISFKNYKYELYDKALIKLLEDKQSIYSAAYIMPSGTREFGKLKKHQNNLMLLEKMISDNIPRKIAKIKSLEELYNLLLDYPTIGSFLAFQYAIDINYSELCDFDENTFVVAGPGAKRGIEKCFKDIGKYKYEDIIRYMTEYQEEEFERLGLNFKTLWGRKLHLIDCQNLFCETDKYARVAFPNCDNSIKGKRIKQKFNANYTKINYFYPPKWEINEYI